MPRLPLRADSLALRRATGRFTSLPSTSTPKEDQTCAAGAPLPLCAPSHAAGSTAPPSALPATPCRCLNLRCADAASCQSLSNNITVVVVDDCPAQDCTAPSDVQLNSFAFRRAAAR